MVVSRMSSSLPEYSAPSVVFVVARRGLLLMGAFVVVVQLVVACQDLRATRQLDIVLRAERALQLGTFRVVCVLRVEQFRDFHDLEPSLIASALLSGRVFVSTSFFELYSVVEIAPPGFATFTMR